MCIRDRKCKPCCIKMQALLHQNASLATSKCKPCCIKMQALLHQNASLAASKCKPCCIKMQALLHQNASLATSKCKPCYIKMQALLHQFYLLVIPFFVRCASGLLQPSGLTRPQRKESSHSLDPAVSKEVTALILLLMATVSVYCQ